MYEVSHIYNTYVYAIQQEVLRPQVVLAESLYEWLSRYPSGAPCRWQGGCFVWCVFDVSGRSRSRNVVISEMLRHPALWVLAILGALCIPRGKS